MSQPRVSMSDFFSTTAAREVNLTDEFWYDAYAQYLDAMGKDMEQSFDAWEKEYTVRVPFEQGYLDVLVRMQPEPREHLAVRLTAFPADDASEPRQISRWYQDEETRPVIGEAALLDSNFRW